MKVLITGIAGKLGRMVAEKLVNEGHEIIGIDRRPWPDAPKGVEMFNVDIRKRRAEDLFRTKRPEVMIHMATVSYFTSRQEERYRINLGGTRSIFEHAHQYGVKHSIFIGRHTFYGAAPDVPLYQTEAAPPLAVSTFPELADLVAADLYAGSAIWRYPDMKTAVLRICYTLGPSKHGTLSSYIRGHRVPTVLGFDPLFQFIHEVDAAEAICTALKQRLQGVFNVAGPAPVPLSVLVKATGRINVPLPEGIFSRVTQTGLFGMPKLPPGAATHIKHSVVIDPSAFQQATNYKHQFNEVQVMEAFRHS